MNRSRTHQSLQYYLQGAAIWLLGWCLLLLLDAKLDLANLGLILVLTSAIASLWLPVYMTLAASVIALMAFNWSFVPPRGTFSIDLHHHAVLLLAMLAVNVLIGNLMASLREQSRRVQAHADAAESLRSWSEQLRDADDPATLLDALQQRLQEICCRASVIIHATDHSSVNTLIETGDTSREQFDALQHCLQSGQALGKNTGHYESLTELYLPLRGRNMTCGAAMLINNKASDHDPAQQDQWQQQAQALCDQMGAALERHHMLEQQRQSRDQAQAQSLRNTFLASISHDYRTPLATILGAASSLQQQGERLLPNQRQQLAQSIIDEADRLRRLTNNILQLARLDLLDKKLQGDWQSIEEIIGSVLHRYAKNNLQQRMVTHIQDDLPLIKADALLLSQLLENLIDNALKYGPADSTITISAARDYDWIKLSVVDWGTTLATEKNELLFEIFQRGDHVQSGGNGVGLALCRAIARAHGGELQLKLSSDSTCFECTLPLTPPPILSSADTTLSP